ncbi:hypothetical protein T484DRAFT_1796863 [Baffinella frigidus]|nr:hypothetical protein T484DRAFT_1796863 [Cryptophyta sp. CCMP2293]
MESPSSLTFGLHDFFVLFMESPSSLTFELHDFAALASEAHKKGAAVHGRLFTS